MSTDKQTPTEALILEVLAARHRLGETLWPFDSRLAPQIRSLETKGLVWSTHGQVENTIRAELTVLGRAAVMGEGYEPPALRAKVRELRDAFVSGSVADLGNASVDDLSAAFETWMNRRIMVANRRSA
jgi:hypothetical protein